MNVRTATPQSHAVRQAARRFTEALGAAALLSRAARVEVVLYADGVGPLFQLDEALAQAWPQAAGDLPDHEVIWARDHAETFEGLRFAAFDPAGRVLLRQAYDTSGGATDDGSAA